MSKQETSPAKCAAAKVRKEITVVISGKAYERLELLAKSLHEWNPCPEDTDTPQTVFDNFFNSDLGMLTHDNPIEPIENVVEGIVTGIDQTEEEKKKERKRLETIMFRNFGIKEVA